MTEWARVSGLTERTNTCTAFNASILVLSLQIFSAVSLLSVRCRRSLFRPYICSVCAAQRNGLRHEPTDTKHSPKEDVKNLLASMLSIDLHIIAIVIMAATSEAVHKNWADIAVGGVW